MQRRLKQTIKLANVRSQKGHMTVQASRRQLRLKHRNAQLTSGLQCRNKALAHGRYENTFSYIAFWQSELSGSL